MRSFTLDRRTRRSFQELLGKTARKMRATNKWKLLSEAVRRKWPLCMSPWCLDRAEPSVCVHHIIGLEEDHTKAFSMDNIVPLCDHCHQMVEDLKVKRKPTAHLFEGWQKNRGE